MGRKQMRLEVQASISDHRDEQDEIDRQLWDGFVAKVREIAARPEYDDILLMVDDMS